MGKEGSNEVESEHKVPKSEGFGGENEGDAIGQESTQNERTSGTSEKKMSAPNRRTFSLEIMHTLRSRV